MKSFHGGRSVLAELVGEQIGFIGKGEGALEVLRLKRFTGLFQEALHRL